MAQILLEVLQEIAEEDRQEAQARARPKSDGAEQVSAKRGVARRLIGNNATETAAKEGDNKGEIITNDESLKRLIKENLRREMLANSQRRAPLQAPTARAGQETKKEATDNNRRPMTAKLAAR
jgi:rRNA-processing protein FCF1